MEKFIPYEKLSKKKQRELNAKKRGTWGDLNPVTRRSENPKAYNRRAAQAWKKSDLCRFRFYSLWRAVCCVIIASN